MGWTKWFGYFVIGEDVFEWDRRRHRLQLKPYDDWKLRHPERDPWCRIIRKRQLRESGACKCGTCRWCRQAGRIDVVDAGGRDIPYGDGSA